MAVTNGWGQGVINNTNGFGKLATNNIGAGSVYENSASGDTVLVAPSAPSFASTRSFNFDGVDDFIQIPYNSIFNQSVYSFSFWIKNDSNSTGGDKGIICADTSTRGFAIQQNSQVLKFTPNISSGASTVSDSDFFNTTSTWIHCALTFDGTDLILYKNGVSAATQSSGTLTLNANNNNLTIGNNPFTSGRFFDGNIDEVSIFNTALSSSDVTSIYNSGVPNDISSLNPVAWYRMGENSNYKSPQWLMLENSNFANSRISNYSYQFDGVNDFVTVNDDASLKVVTANHSLSFWMKTTDGSTQVLSEKGSSDELAAWVVSNKIRWAGPNTFNSSIDVNDGNWKHIAFVADGSSSFIYINGSLDATGSTKIQASANSSNYVFGARSGGSFAFDGQLDQIAIFNRALSSTEVSALYNSGTPTTLPSGAVAHYKLGEEATFSTNWTIPDQVGSNDGTSSNMTIEDRVGDSPNSTNNAVSFNMVEADRETDVPS